MISPKKIPKNPLEFSCITCDYNTCNKKDYNKHVVTIKHLRLINATLDESKNPLTYNCGCGKKYKHISSLYKHKTSCLFKNDIKNIDNTDDLNNDTPDKELIKFLIKENSEIKNLILEVCKNAQPINNINNSTMNNSNNKTFNLQFFLNETCKDAMNIMDFVDSIKIQLCDIESIGELGFVNGMSKLIIKNLNALAENMRPVHCNDPKRDSLYVKDANVWEKEDLDNKKIKKAIKYISHKNICAIPQWKAKYPDCIYSDSKKSDQYNHIVVEAMGGSGDNDAEKADKIVKKIAKEVTINKNN
jgi:hypothetical protein